MEDDVLHVEPTAGEDPDDCHGEVGDQEGDVQYRKQIYQVPVSLRNDVLTSMENFEYSLLQGLALFSVTTFSSSNCGPRLLHLPDDDIVEDHQEDGGDDLHDELREDGVDDPGVAPHDLLLRLSLIPAVGA